MVLKYDHSCFCTVFHSLTHSGLSTSKKRYYQPCWILMKSPSIPSQNILNPSKPCAPKLTTFEENSLIRFFKLGTYALLLPPSTSIYLIATAICTLQGQDTIHKVLGIFRPNLLREQDQLPPLPTITFEGSHQSYLLRLDRTGNIPDQ